MLPLNLVVLQCFHSFRIHHHSTIFLLLDGFLRLGVIIIMGLVPCFLPRKQVQGTGTRFMRHKKEQDDNKVCREHANVLLTPSASSLSSYPLLLQKLLLVIVILSLHDNSQQLNNFCSVFIFVNNFCEFSFGDEDT